MANTNLTPDRTPEGWGSTAADYERVIVRITSPFAAEAVARLQLMPGERVLDVACGPGTAAFLAADAGASVLATDFSPGMIAQLQQAVRDRGLRGVEAAVMDGQALDLAADMFDAATCVFGLMFFLDQQAGVRELHRVLKPGGRVAIVTWGPPERNAHLTLQREALLEAVPDFPTPPEPPAVFSLSEPARVEELLRSAGFDDVRVEPLPREARFDTPEDWWALLTASPLFGAVKEHARDRLDRIHDVLVARAEERYGREDLRVPCEALIATATKPA